MTSRTLIIPAAGRGSRLGADIPKVLVPVAGQPMLVHLLRLYREFVEQVIVVASPDALDLLAPYALGNDPQVVLAVQPKPTGMLDAILVPHSIVQQATSERLWITWCDQVAVLTETLHRLVEHEVREAPPDVVMPTMVGPEPYIHLERDEHGRIIAIRQRRESDHMPAVGESDMGLFSLSRSTYLQTLPRYSDTVEAGNATRERNFLPFLVWCQPACRVVTFPGTDPHEALGINTPDDLRRIEAYWRSSQGRKAGE